MLYIMRHGKTQWNTLGKLQGRTDIPLNEEGRNMAIEAAEEYKDIKIDICYCSPLKRAKETAELFLKERQVPIIEDARLMEMCFGSYEGMTDYLTIKNHPISVIFQEPESYKESVGEAETFDELFGRTGEFLKEIVGPQLAQGKNVLIVGHGAMNASIVCQVKKLPVSEFWKAGLAQCKLMELS